VEKPGSVIDPAEAANCPSVGVGSGPACKEGQQMQSYVEDQNANLEMIWLLSFLKAEIRRI
jgi:hypothetical protein